MIITYNIYTLGHRDSRKAAWSAIIVAETNDKRTKERVVSEELPPLNRRQTDMAAIVKALQCIPPEHRGITINIYTLTGYAFEMLERDNITWKLEPDKHTTELDFARSMFAKFKDLRLKRIETVYDMYRKCLSAARKIVEGTNG